jgi:hypothetical protein
MAKEYKTGFLYIYSDVLKQEVAWSKKTGKVFCEDKVYGTEKHVEYSQQEIQIFQEAGMQVDIATHTVKKVFGGEVIRIERAGTDNSGKRPAGAGPENSPDHPHSGAALEGTSGNHQAGREGELDIY